jgi:hypothetical protein
MNKQLQISPITHGVEVILDAWLAKFGGEK